jgi:hypothetical protein
MEPDSGQRLFEGLGVVCVVSEGGGRSTPFNEVRETGGFVFCATCPDIQRPVSISDTAPDLCLLHQQTIVCVG